MKVRGSKVFGFRIAVFVTLAISLSSNVYPAEAPVRKVIVAYSSYSPSALWFLLEKDLGFFREEGLRSEFILTKGGGIGLAGLIAGNFDYVHIPVPVIDAIIRGRQPFKMIFTAGMIHLWLVAQPEIRTISDLKGKVIGAASPGSISDLLIREIFKRHGLDPFRDATFLGVGGSRERFAALTSGAVHATVISPPLNFKALEMGYRKLASASDYVMWPQTGLGTTEKKILQDPEEVAKVVRASLKGLKFVLTHRDYVVSKIMQIFRLTRDEAVQSYEALREEYIPSGYLTEEAQRTVIAMLKTAANITQEIPPERVFDNRFVKQAERELKGWKPQVPR